MKANPRGGTSFFTTQSSAPPPWVFTYVLRSIHVAVSSNRRISSISNPRQPAAAIPRIHTYRARERESEWTLCAACMQRMEAAERTYRSSNEEAREAAMVAIELDGNGYNIYNIFLSLSLSCI
eukprot:GHVU01221617.1.p1 GENE.GHVU01221617.1~~GHVU01221617.1.p1  ORF type:complete len:123 (-),score=10.97 GHVU01221617.1:229-597(-)